MFKKCLHIFPKVTNKRELHRKSFQMGRKIMDKFKKLPPRQ